MAAASTLAVMLEGPARAFLQVAEHRDIARSNSFTTLSSSLGQLVIQLHIGAQILIIGALFLYLLSCIWRGAVTYDQL